MRIVNINGVDITFLQDEDIARYIKRIYASAEMRSFAQSGKSFDGVKGDTSMLAEFLVQYAISTGDLSGTSISKISKNFINRQADLKKLIMSNASF